MAFESLESLGKKLARLGQDTKSSVQKLGENYQLNSRISDEKKALEKAFAEIGEAVFNADPDNAPEGLEEVFELVKQSKEAIADLEGQIQKLKTKDKEKDAVVCPECGKEAADGEKFCSACGTKLPEAVEKAADEVEEVVSDLAEDVKDVAGDAGDVVNEAADKARDFMGVFAGKADAFVKGVASRLGGEKAVENLDGVAQNLQEKAQEAAAKVREAVKDAAGQVKDTEEEVEDAAEEAADDLFDDLGIKEEAEDWFSDTADAAKEAVDTAAEAAEEVAEDAAEAVEEAAEAVEDAAEEIEAAEEKTEE